MRFVDTRKEKSGRKEHRAPRIDEVSGVIRIYAAKPIRAMLRGRVPVNKPLKYTLSLNLVREYVIKSIRINAGRQTTNVLSIAPRSALGSDSSHPRVTTSRSINGMTAYPPPTVNKPILVNLINKSSVMGKEVVLRGTMDIRNDSQRMGDSDDATRL